jgi:hypothetical protein
VAGCDRPDRRLGSIELGPYTAVDITQPVPVARVFVTLVAHLMIADPEREDYPRYA